MRGKNRSPDATTVSTMRIDRGDVSRARNQHLVHESPAPLLVLSTFSGSIVAEILNASAQASCPCPGLSKPTARVAGAVAKPWNSADAALASAAGSDDRGDRRSAHGAARLVMVRRGSLKPTLSTLRRGPAPRRVFASRRAAIRQGHVQWGCGRSRRVTAILGRTHRLARDGGVRTRGDTGRDQ